MNTILTRLTTAAAIVGAVALAGCDLDVGDLNNPGIGDLEENPTRVTVNSACTGLVIGNRGNFSAANGVVSQLGIVGRESFTFDGADPRYVSELLTAPLNPGSPFGGNFWTGPYANIRLSNVIIGAVDKVEDFSDEERSAIRGFARTIQALDLLLVTVTRDTNGIVIDTDRELEEDLAPLVDPDEAYDAIIALLDAGAAELDAGGAAFSFPLSSGYAGFDDPASFRTFNRAIAARVHVYRADYAAALTALAESFLVGNATTPPTPAELDLGVYHAYSTGAGDTVNGLINPNIFANPALLAEAEANDARAAAKLVMVETGGGQSGLSSNVKFTLYATPSDPTPIIRNEELLLLQAEALYFTGMTAEGIAVLNLVREVSGGMDLAPVNPATEADFIDALLYERRYSLLFEGGHRWIDLRRFMLTDRLDIADFEDVINVRYPIPRAECDARGGPEVEPRCALSSM